jgi:hypothetical protein
MAPPSTMVPRRKNIARKRKNIARKSPLEEVKKLFVPLTLTVVLIDKVYY